MSRDPPLLPDDWEQLAPLIDRLLDTPPSERPALLAQLSGDDAAKRAELQRLLAECEREDPLLDGLAVDRFAQLSDDEEPALPEVLGGRYRIERELGRGGMACVYLAQDLRHERRVAVKVVRQEIASSLMHDRFLREIAIAARLRHPNIMPLFDSGDEDGQLYFVMPYEAGKSLRARLDRERGLGVAEGVSILRDIARALAYAHEQNVVHRDIKPDNVLLSGDAAVVTDFGIAKAVTAAAETGSWTITQAGTIIGTPSYMAPEQALGDPATDHRADIYAFGCLAYEMFAGAPPFTGAATHQLIAAKLSERPKALTEIRPDVPGSISGLIERCLENDPDARPSSAAELLDGLGSTAGKTQPALFVRRRPRRMLAAILVLAVLIAGGWYANVSTRGGAVPIAVVTLRVTGDSARALAAGFSEELANALQRKPWLLVKSRGGALNYAGRGEIDPRAAGDSLGVQYLLMTSYLDTGGGTTVMLQLIRCEDYALVWAEPFRNPVDLAGLRDRIANAVADTLRPVAGRFAARFPASTPARRPVKDEPYRLVVLGKTQLAQRGRSVGSAIATFREAIALDSGYADAWSGLSMALAMAPLQMGVPIDSISREARASAEHALRLDASLSEPHAAMAHFHALNREWEKAESSARTALERNSDNADDRIQYARILIALGRLPAAMREIEAAREIDPASSYVLAYKSLVHLTRGELDSAEVWSDRAIQHNPTNIVARVFRAMLMVRLNRPAEARQLVADLHAYEPFAPFVLAAVGDTVAVRVRLAAAESRPSLSETVRAFAFLGSGDTTAALNALERATDRREIWHTIAFNAPPAFDRVRGSPRFRELLRRVGLPAR